ncbi:AraC family transcriptional regulator ligand-binding domain-containing protein [Novosphingobium sp.]|uniref:AraC family transcriptional regulator ligand-binding domain-containing protein n=1 Tax=Novosphingobium sp. TaxID=1874826 RepID=UPI003342603D
MLNTALAHTAALQQFARYAHSSGIDLDAILGDAHRAVLHAARTSELVPAQALVDIFQIVAIAARRDDLGVGFAMWCNLHGYGPLSLLWDHCTSVDQLLRLSGRYLHLETEAIGSTALAEGDEVAVVQFLTVPTLLGGSHYLDATITLQLRTIRLILGQQWHPLRMEFAHPAPDQLGFHRSVFRCPLVFGAERCALVLHRDDLARTSPHGNAHLTAYLERQLETAHSLRRDDVLRPLERLVTANLAGGGLTLDRAASTLGLGARTLQRALAARGMTFSDVLTTVRRRVADDYFTNQRKPNLTDLAHRLGYAEASAASRFLRERLSTGARGLRRRARTA